MHWYYTRKDFILFFFPRWRGRDGRVTVGKHTQTAFSVIFRLSASIPSLAARKTLHTIVLFHLSLSLSLALCHALSLPLSVSLSLSLSLSLSATLSLSLSLCHTLSLSHSLSASLSLSLSLSLQRDCCFICKEEQGV